MLKEGKWVVFIGPRMFFSTRDGAYIPPNLRHHCIKYVESDEPLPNQQSPTHVIEDLYFRPMHSGTPGLDALLGPTQRQNSAEERDHFREWLGRCRVRDTTYKEWYLRLCGRLAVDEKAFPVRPDREISGDDLRSSFDIAEVCADGEIGSTRWPAPPVGRCLSSGTSNIEYDSAIKVAQPREEDAPDLVWPHGSNNWSDSKIDEGYENK